MNELFVLFVPYEESLQLKELGFDEPTLYHWHNSCKTHPFTNEVCNPNCKPKTNSGIKDIGDVIWYVTAMCTEINTTISQLAEELENDTLKKYASADYVQKKIIRLNGKVKKYYRDNVDYSGAIKEVLKEVLFYIISNSHNELSEILSINYKVILHKTKSNWR